MRRRCSGRDPKTGSHACCACRLLHPLLLLFGAVLVRDDDPLLFFSLAFPASSSLPPSFRRTPGEADGGRGGEGLPLAFNTRGKGSHRDRGSRGTNARVCVCPRARTTHPRTTTTAHSGTHTQLQSLFSLVRSTTTTTRQRRRRWRRVRACVYIYLCPARTLDHDPEIV